MSPCWHLQVHDYSVADDLTKFAHAKQASHPFHWCNNCVRRWASASCDCRGWIFVPSNIGSQFRCPLLPFILVRILCTPLLSRCSIGIPDAFHMSWTKDWIECLRLRIADSVRIWCHHKMHMAQKITYLHAKIKMSFGSVVSLVARRSRMYLCTV